MKKQLHGGRNNMKILTKILCTAFLLTAITSAAYAMASATGVCNNSSSTQYTCCLDGIQHENGDAIWNIGSTCPFGLSGVFCLEDAGKLLNSDKTILQDCQSKDGTAVDYYPFSKNHSTIR